MAGAIRLGFMTHNEGAGEARRIYAETLELFAATDQLGFSQDARKKSEEAAAKGDWQNAMLWANQWWQYQVKAADLGLRAKALLDQGGAKPTKP